MKRTVYTLWQIIWGFPQTIVGAVLYLACKPKQRTWFKGVLVSTLPIRSSVSLGMFIFISSDAAVNDSLAKPRRKSLQKLIAHEYGHTIQSAFLGPLYLLVIGLPSAIWANARPFRQLRRTQGRSYYSFYTERLANWLSSRILHLETPQ